MTAAEELLIRKTNSGLVRGFDRGDSIAFLGIPFAEAPVGPLRFAAPQRRKPWDGVRDCTEYGATPLRTYNPETLIPEPAFPGEDTLNLNVFIPKNEGEGALPVFVWIHGGGFFSGSPSGQWFDGKGFNRDGVIFVAISYRLAFDGFGWIEDAPTNRGILDMIAGLTWVQENISAFGGDPDRVTIAGQSAGGSAIMDLMVSPLAEKLFQQGIAQSPASLSVSLQEAERRGRQFAADLGVAPTVEGWASVSNEALDAAQAALMAPSGPPPATLAEQAALLLSGEAMSLPFIPLTGDNVLPTGITESLEAGAGKNKPLLIGTVAHEFAMISIPQRTTWAGQDPVEALVDAGVDEQAAALFIDGQADLKWEADRIGQIASEMVLRTPTVLWADAHQGPTWVYDFRWISPTFEMSPHCVEIPFAFDVLNGERTAGLLGENPPQELADEVHRAWVDFIKTSEPGWSQWDGRGAKVFNDPSVAQTQESYAVSQLVSGWLADK